MILSDEDKAKYQQRRREYYGRMVIEFLQAHPMEDWDGNGQEFFERIGECDMLQFFHDLYGVPK